MTKIKVSGRNIVGCNGFDHTGALKELGIDYKFSYDRKQFSEICNTTFEVDLDFILRHGLMDSEIYKNNYIGTPQYNKYYNEGKQAFLDGKDDPLDNPYTNKTIKDKDYWLDDLQVKGYPWYDGYRETESINFEKKYKLSKLQNEIRNLVKSYGLKIEYTDEYHTPFIKTPEGYTVELA